MRDQSKRPRNRSRQDQKLRLERWAPSRTVSPLLSPGCVLPGLDAAFAGLYGVPGLPSIGQYGTPRNDDFFYGTIDVKEHQTALFGEVTYEVVPKVDVTLGARYFNFKQDFNLFFTGLAGALAPASRWYPTAPQRRPAATRGGSLLQAHR